jgi:hypothetical protein
LQTKTEQRDECLSEFCPCSGVCGWCCGDASNGGDFKSQAGNAASKKKADAAAVGFAPPPGPRGRAAAAAPAGGTRGQGAAAKSLADRMRQSAAQRDAYREKHYGR